MELEHAHSTWTRACRPGFEKNEARVAYPILSSTELLHLPFLPSTSIYNSNDEIGKKHPRWNSDPDSIAPRHTTSPPSSWRTAPYRRSRGGGRWHATGAGRLGTARLPHSHWLDLPDLILLTAPLGANPRQIIRLWAGASNTYVHHQVSWRSDGQKKAMRVQRERVQHFVSSASVGY